MRAPLALMGGADPYGQAILTHLSRAHNHMGQRIIYRLVPQMFAVCSAAFAQFATADVSFEGRPIRAIEFSSVQPLASKDLERAQPLKAGQPFRRADVAQAIDGLFATGYFDDIAVEI